MVILVDNQDNQVGYSPKMDAHLTGSLHRAVSVLVFDSRGRMLLQRRAAGKYHSAGLWANACCTHPLPGEPAHKAAARRLVQEMGIPSDLTYRGAFTYRAEVGGGLTEHEYDHIFTGVTDREPLPDPREVERYRYMYPDELAADVAARPGDYAPWFRIILSRFNDEIQQWAK